MTTSVVIELVRANSNALEVAVRVAAASFAEGWLDKEVEAEPTAEFAPEMEDLLAMALHFAALGRRRWERAKGLLQDGLPSHLARPLLCSSLDQGQLHEGALGHLLALSLRAKNHGIVLAQADSLPAAIEEVKARLRELREILELLDRPRAPIDREQLRLSRESFPRGEGRDVRDVLAERGWSGVP